MTATATRSCPVPDWCALEHGDNLTYHVSELVDVRAIEGNPLTVQATYDEAEDRLAVWVGDKEFTPAGAVEVIDAIRRALAVKAPVAR